MTTFEAANRHATALVIGDRGVLIEGPSGSGKTLLALTLLQACAVPRFARLVADDQVFVSARSGRLVAAAPDAIAGLAEARGAGPGPVEAERAAVIDLVVTLVAAEEAPRLAESEPLVIQGVEVPHLRLGRRDAQAAAFAVAARLRLSPFVHWQATLAEECGKMARL